MPLPRQKNEAAMALNRRQADTDKHGKRVTWAARIAFLLAREHNTNGHARRARVGPSPRPSHTPLNPPPSAAPKSNHKTRNF